MGLRIGTAGGTSGGISCKRSGRIFFAANLPLVTAAEHHTAIFTVTSEGQQVALCQDSAVTSVVSDPGHAGGTGGFGGEGNDFALV